MQKYKVKQDSCGPSKSSKPHPIASVISNKSLTKHPSNNQNKSTLSVLNSSDVNNYKSLHQRVKSSKHLENHTFTNNTHHNSVNIVSSHNNSKSNHKGQDKKKKSAGKKISTNNPQTRMIS